MRFLIPLLVSILVFATIMAIDSIGSDPKIYHAQLIVDKEYEPEHYIPVSDGYTTTLQYVPAVWTFTVEGEGVVCTVSEDTYYQFNTGDRVSIKIYSGLLFDTTRYCKGVW